MSNNPFDGEPSVTYVEATGKHLAHSYFMMTRVMGKPWKLKSASVELFTGEAAFLKSEPAVIFTFEYESGSFTRTVADQTTPAFDLDALSDHFTAEWVAADGHDMAHEYKTEFAPFHDLDVNERGLLVYFTDLPVID